MSSDSFATFRRGMGSCGVSIGLGVIAAVGYAARFSVSSKESAADSIEVPLDHTAKTFEMVISNVLATIVLATIP